MSDKNLDYYAQRFANLRIDKSHGSHAPHKPLLLLSIVELIERGIISCNEIELTPEVVATFLKYWTVFFPAHKGLVALPFFHLRSDGFWHLLPRQEYEQAFKLIRHIKSNYQMRDMVRYAFLDAELFVLLLSDRNRTTLRQIIVKNYFQGEDRKKIVHAINISREAMKYERMLIAEATDLGDLGKTMKKKRFPEKVRAVGFRHAIMSIYNYTCSVCGMRIMTLEGSSIVEAAHINGLRIIHTFTFSPALSPQRGRWLSEGYFNVQPILRPLILSHSVFLRTTIFVTASHYVNCIIGLLMRDYSVSTKIFVLWCRRY